MVINISKKPTFKKKGQRMNDLGYLPGSYHVSRESMEVT